MWTPTVTVCVTAKKSSDVKMQVHATSQLMRQKKMVLVSTITCLGCTDVLACNYTLGSLIDDGSCDYCSCALDGDGGQNGFGLAVEEHAVGGIAGMTTYRLYVTTPGPTDFVSAVAGDELNPSYLRTSTSFYQDENGGLTAGAINPLLFDFFPSSAYDSWLTIGIDQAPAAGDDSVQDVTLAAAAGDTWADDFEAGGNLELNSFFGGSWFTPTSCPTVWLVTTTAC